MFLRVRPNLRLKVLNKKVSIILTYRPIILSSGHAHILDYSIHTVMLYTYSIHTVMLHTYSIHTVMLYLNAKAQGVWAGGHCRDIMLPSWIQDVIVRDRASFQLLIW